MTINKVVKKSDETSSHLNFMDGNSWDISDPFSRIRMIAASSFFGEPKYYDEDGKINAKKSSKAYENPMYKYLSNCLGLTTPKEWLDSAPSTVIENCIEECLDKDIEKTLQLAVTLRNDDNIRVTPQVIMVLAAMHKNSIGTGLVQKYANQIMKRGDEPATQLAYFIAKYGKDGKLDKTAIPVRLRRTWKKYLESLNDYSLSKYQMKNRGVKTIDVVRLTRANSPSIDKLFKETLKQENTWEAIISAKGSNNESWTEALDVMGHMAMLRNIRNLLDKGVDSSLFIEKLKSGVEKGKQLPFRYYSSYKVVEGRDRHIDNALEDCIEMSYNNAPRIKGKTISLVDNSGSACDATTSEMGSMRVCDIGNLTGVVTAKLSDEGYVGVFGDRLDIFQVGKNASTFKMAEKANKIGEHIGKYTENGIWLFFDKAIKTKEHYDNIFVYSDMQAGHGRLYGSNDREYSDYLFLNSGKYIDVPKLINKYRQEVNPKVKVFLVQIAGYSDTIMPEYYKDVYILGGWSAGILSFAAKMINGNTN